jgi:hypothetical protein
MNEVVTVVGYCPFKFTPKGEDREVSGVSVFYTQQSDRKGMVGEAAGKFSLSSKTELPPGFGLGCDVELLYNKYGKVQAINVVH